MSEADRDEAFKTGNAFGPLNRDLYQRSVASKGHISDQAVMDEYHRLIAIRETPTPRRSFWQWLRGH